MTDANENDGKFYARADNLNYWLNEVQNRLGSLSLKLSQSVGRSQLNVDKDGALAMAKVDADEEFVKTPWLKIDDAFYEARGATWALAQLMRAAEVDFASAARKRHLSFRQMVRELEATQETVWSPMILNGDGFGMLANHSLVMANYVSRANAALIDLRKLVEG